MEVVKVFMIKRKETGMKKRCLLLACIILLVASCASFWREAADPNSSQNIAVAKVGEVAVVAKENASLFGPVGIPVAAISSAIIALVGLYNNKRKNLKLDGKDMIITGQNVAFNNVTETTRAIVEAIDVLEKATGVKIKEEVKKKLQEHEIYKLGKSIISGLKK